MKHNDFLNFLCRTPERIAQNHSSTLFSTCSSTEVISFNFSPSMHTYTRAQHSGILSLSRPPCIHLSLSLFLSLHCPVLLLNECIHVNLLSNTVTCYPFPFFVLVQYINNCAHCSSCLSSESLSLHFLFPFFFFRCFLLFQCLLHDRLAVTVPHTWSQCVVQVNDRRQVVSELQLWHLEFILGDSINGTLTEEETDQMWTI